MIALSVQCKVLLAAADLTESDAKEFFEIGVNHGGQRELGLSLVFLRSCSGCSCNMCRGARILEWEGCLDGFTGTRVVRNDERVPRYMAERNSRGKTSLLPRTGGLTEKSACTAILSVMVMVVSIYACNPVFRWPPG